MELSIIIVNYKTEELILKCIKNILQISTLKNMEFIIIDNNKSTYLKNELNKINNDIIYKQMLYNVGFGRANNYALELAKGEYLIFMNPDIIITDGNLLYNLIELIKQKNKIKKHIIGIKLINNDDGSIQKSRRLSFPGLKDILWRNSLHIIFYQRLFNKNPKQEYEKQEYKANENSGIARWLGAALLIVKKQDLLKDNLLYDNDFFLYAEDLEWCYKANKKGYTLWYEQSMEAKHIGSVSTHSKLIKRAQIKVSEWLFFRKSYGLLYFLVYISFELFTELLNELLFTFNKKSRKNEFFKSEYMFRKVFWHIIRKFFFNILFLHKLSSETHFKLNCYEDVFINKISQKDF